MSPDQRNRLLGIQLSSAVQLYICLGGPFSHGAAGLSQYHLSRPIKIVAGFHGKPSKHFISDQNHVFFHIITPLKVFLFLKIVSPI